MSVYVDASALLKIYVEETDSAEARRILTAEPRWATGRHTLIEVRRNLARLLDGSALETYRGIFDTHWAETRVVELREDVCGRSAELAELTGARTLDALHLGAAAAAGADDGLPIVTFDRRLADAARALGWRVLPE